MFEMIIVTDEVEKFLSYPTLEEANLAYANIKAFRARNRDVLLDAIPLNFAADSSLFIDLDSSGISDKVKFSKEIQKLIADHIRPEVSDIIRDSLLNTNKGEVE